MKAEVSVCNRAVFVGTDSSDKAIADEERWPAESICACRGGWDSAPAGGLEEESRAAISTDLMVSGAVDTGAVSSVEAMLLLFVDEACSTDLSLGQGEGGRAEDFLVLFGN